MLKFGLTYTECYFLGGRGWEAIFGDVRYAVV